MSIDFNPAWANKAERRAPTDAERDNGFPCGPASRPLFNYLFNLLEGNMGYAAAQQGVASLGNGDLTVLHRTLAAAIAAAIGPSGNPDLSNFVLMNQARARFPIYPEVLNTDGRITMVSPGSGVVRIPGGVDFLHRGIGLITTSQTDYNTDPSKTYHARWNPIDGFALKDLASPGYNPTALAETNATFDSKYDDMLIARIITNAGNVATIDSLANKDRLFVTFSKNTMEKQAGTWGGLPALSGAQNWSRTPKQISVPSYSVEATNGFEATVKQTVDATRYTCSGFLQGYAPNDAQPYISGSMTVQLEA